LVGVDTLQDVPAAADPPDFDPIDAAVSAET
jgi:hypothetical protein